MMEQTLRLDFKCPSKTEDFTTVESGFHCSQCDKKVLDFSKDKTYIIAELSKVWPYFRTLAMFATLFFLLINVKAISAQATLDTIPTPNGYQRITLSGTAYNDIDNGEGIPKANLFIYFDGEILERCITDLNGEFECTLENYGGIREVDILVRADNYFSKDLKNIPVVKERSVINIPLQQKGILIKERREEIPVVIEPIAVENRGFSKIGFAKVFDIPLVLTDDIYPSYEDNLPKYVDKLHYPIVITDYDENPIPNSKIEMYLSNGEMRWGITNKYGFVKILAQLNETAHYAKLVIKSEGYSNKIRYDFKLGSKNVRIFKLRKKNKQKTA